MVDGALFRVVNFLLCSQDERVACEVIITMVEFGEEEMERGNLNLALEHFSELLELLNVKFIPGVQLSRAECLLRLVNLSIYGLFNTSHNTM